MKKGFTLLELLIVVGIMSMLGTISVNGYRAVVRGMEERSAISSTSAFLRAARQRAQIDNKPICIFWWNEMLKAETEDEPAIIVGKAIAVQQVGRISGTDGDLLIDEFSDLDAGYEVAPDGTNPDTRMNMRLYNISSTECDYALVSTQVAELFYEDDRSSYLKSDPNERKLKSESSSSGLSEEGVRVFAFKKLGGSASFEAGDAYGMEFANITLPHGYLFGSQAPTSMSQPISGRDKKLYSKPKTTDKSVFNIEIFSLRPDKGKLTSKSVGSAKDTY